MNWQEHEQIRMFFDSKDLHKYAVDGLIDDIQLENFIQYGVTRVVLTINGAERCGVKVTNRSKNKPDKEKLFRSITGVHQWAFNLMKLTWSEEDGGKRGVPSITSKIIDMKRIFVDGVMYDDENPFDMDSHSEQTAVT